MVPLLLLPLLWGGSVQQPQDYELQVQESVMVQEGLCAHVPCSFYPWSSWYSSTKVYTYWYQNGANTYRHAPVASNNPDKAVKTETQGRFLLANPTTNNCSLQIRDARKSDRGRYFLRVEIGYPEYNHQGKVQGYNFQGYSYKYKMLDLQVTALTEKPHIRVREPLESGRPTQLACSLPGACEGGRPLTFSWAGAAVDSLNRQTLDSSVLTFTPRPRDHGTNFTCQVKQQGSQWTTQRTIQLNVSYAPGNLTIGVSFRNDTVFKNLQTTSLPILEGEALRLRCEADSNPPAELSWFRGSPGLNATPLSSTAILELPRVGPAQEGQFTCQARHPLGSHNVSLSLSVVSPPQLLGPSCSWEDQGLHCSCSSRAQPAPSLRWWLGAGLLEGNHGNASHVVTSSSEGPWTNSSLILREGLSPDLRLSCEARNVHGTQSVSVLLLPGKAVPQAGVVPAALGGAGAMALLSLCFCLIFFCIVKARRRQAAGRTKVMNDEEPVMGTVTWGSKKNLPPDAPPDQAPPAEKGPLSGEPQELYYANLTFEGLKPREPPDQAATSTHEYSEVKRARQ
ncbi:sialic acid-binding Ig-like lectin 5 [Myotis daubentonii]|uniref:sialic acid-binding Ig-like lectin 5 n=1 Tax=Myotis daubentonii TaxID=98922 RepID=UPI002873C9E7|nr:sialic acid-binding Ig-like lectin 5 [Myotis daubentonii]